jgi:hypothetical protein
MKGFTFDRVFGVESQQQEIFDWGVKGIVQGVFCAPSVADSKRCHDGLQRHPVLLRSDGLGKDVQ